MKTGDELLISSGSNVDYYCHISEMTDDNIRAEIDSIDEEGRELGIKVWLFQGLPKGDKMEIIIQKMTELGVYRIVPVSMKRSVVKLDKKKADSKVKRWNMISESAAKQSKRSIIPEIMPVCTFNEALEMSHKSYPPSGPINIPILSLPFRFSMIFFVFAIPSAHSYGSSLTSNCCDISNASL